MLWRLAQKQPQTVFGLQGQGGAVNCMETQGFGVIVRPVTVTYKIEDTDDTVTVTAGTFGHCLRVHGKGYLFAGRTLQEFMGIDTINIDQTEWYAPGVGLVKSVREEYTQPNEFRNTYTRELQSYTRE